MNSQYSELHTGFPFPIHQPNRTIPMSNNNELKEWKAETKCFPLADTGDYDSWVELSNGEICLSTDESDEEELQEVADRLNALSGIPDPEQWVSEIKAENERLKKGIRHAMEHTKKNNDNAHAILHRLLNPIK